MTVTLEQALEQVDLEPGQTYCCRVKGMRVELRVLSEGDAFTPDPISESDVMLDPWVEFPLPAGAPVRVVAATQWLPDPPILPEDEDWPDS